MKHVKALFNACAVLLSCSLYANDDVYRLLDLSLEQLVEVKIKTASLTEQTVATAPAAMTVFTRAEIDRLAVSYLHELLSYVPGYQASRELDYSYQYSTSARARKTGASSREILYLLDGVPVNNPRNGNSGAVFMYPVTHIERVEVMRGPGSALYGSNAITGVVNIISRKTQSYARVGFGNLNAGQVELAVHNQIGAWDLSLSLYGERDSGEDYMVPDTFSNNRVATQDPMSQKQLRFIAETSHSALQLHYREIDSDDFYNTGRISNDYNYSSQENTLLSARHRFNWWHNIESSITASFVQVHSINGNQSTPNGAFKQISNPSSDAPLYGYGEFKTQRIKLNWQNTYQLNTTDNIIFGTEIQREALTRALGFTNYNLAQLTSQSFPITYYGKLGPGVAIADQTGINSAGIFGQYQTSFNQHWFATIGLRYDRYEMFPSRTSPRLSIVHQTDNKHTFKLLYGEAYRVPNFSEVGFRNTVTVLSNPSLRHEIAKTWDLIWLKKWQHTQIQFGLFANTFEDPITAALSQGRRTFTNGSNEKSKGAELELQFQPEKEWFLRMTASRFWQLPQSAYRESSNTASLHANYQHNLVNVNLGAIYIGERTMNLASGDTLAIDDYWLLNGKIKYPLNERWHLSLMVKNMLDNEYQTPAIGSSLSEGIPNRGREWLLSAEYQF